MKRCAKQLAIAILILFVCFEFVHLDKPKTQKKKAQKKPTPLDNPDHVAVATLLTNLGSKKTKKTLVALLSKKCRDLKILQRAQTSLNALRTKHHVIRRLRNRRTVSKAVRARLYNNFFLRLLQRLLKCSVVSESKVAKKINKATKLLKKGRKVKNALSFIRKLAKATQSKVKKAKGFFYAVRSYYKFLRRKKLIKKILSKQKKSKKVKKSKSKKSKSKKNKKSKKPTKANKNRKTGKGAKKVKKAKKSNKKGKKSAKKSKKNKKSNKKGKKNGKKVKKVKKSNKKGKKPAKKSNRKGKKSNKKDKKSNKKGKKSNGKTKRTSKKGKASAKKSKKSNRKSKKSTKKSKKVTKTKGTKKTKKTKKVSPKSKLTKSIAKAKRLRGKTFVSDASRVAFAKIRSISKKMKHYLKRCTLFKGSFARKSCRKVRALRQKLNALGKRVYRRLKSTCKSTRTVCIYKGTKKYCRKSHKVCQAAARLNKKLAVHGRMSRALIFGKVVALLITRIINKQ